jgi:hypothetical protein
VDEALQEVEPEEAPVSGSAVASFRSRISRPVISRSLISMESPPRQNSQPGHCQKLQLEQELQVEQALQSEEHEEAPVSRSTDALLRSRISRSVISRS